MSNMEHQQDQLDAIKDIRSMMERSSRFLSLSGLAGIVVGLIAIASHCGVQFFRYAIQ